METPLESDLLFINLGHNQGSSIDIQTIYEELINKMFTKYENAGVVCISQNPQRTPEVNIIPHALRCEQISQIANVNDYGFIDIYRIFNETGDLASYMNDGAHPNIIGQQLWRDIVVRYIEGAFIKV